MLEHHKALFWFGGALLVAGLFWYLEQNKLVATATTLTPLGQGDPQFLGGQTQWLGLSPNSPSAAIDSTPEQILTTVPYFSPGANQPGEIGVPTVSTPTPAEALASVPGVPGTPPIHFPLTAITQAQAVPSSPGMYAYATRPLGLGHL